MIQLKSQLSQPAQEVTINKIVVGIDLGNNTTRIFHNQKNYQIDTELTINLNSKQIFIGRQITNLEQVLKNKQKFLKQGQSKNQNQNINPSQSQSSKRFVDILDLFVKSFTEMNQERKSKENSLLDSRLPHCFSYYPHEFHEVQNHAVGVVLLKGSKIRKEDSLIIRQKNEKHPKKQGQDLVEKVQKESITIDEFLHLFLREVLKQIVLHDIHSQSLQKTTLSSKPTSTHQIQLIINHYGFQGNPYLNSLSNLSTMFQTPNSNIKSKVSFVQTTTSLAIYYYLKHLESQQKELQTSTIIGCLDFGARGCTFSLFKLYPTSQAVIQTLEHYTLQFGGVNITRIIMDLIVENVKLHKGVNVKSTPQMIQELYKLAESTKISLNDVNQVFVRIEGYPLPEPYGFYLKKINVENRIKQIIFQMIDQIQELCEKQIKKSASKSSQISCFVVSGQSCSIPLFSSTFAKKIVQRHKANVVQADPFWIAQGNYLWRSSGVVLLQKSVNTIKVKGDEDYSQVIVQQGRELPLRLFKEIQFPRGQLTYTLKFYENQFQIGKYVIESKNLQWGENLNFVAEREQNKPLFIYSNKYLGHINMKGNKLCRAITLNRKFTTTIFQKP